MALAFESTVEKLEQEIKKLEQQLSDHNEDQEGSKALQHLKLKLNSELERIYNNLSPWDIVQIARLLERPQFLDYKDALFDEFIEIHGDRVEKDEQALIGGFATIGGEKVVILGQQRGKTVEEAIKKYNKGSLKPNGYWKALRIMKMANHFNLPIITFIDTSGADPGVEAEEKGQGEAIARSMKEMSAFNVPIISVVIGEGGSGGAIGIGVANVVLMLQYAIYSVISPEGAAAILFHNGNMASKAAENLKITAKQLHHLGLVDEVIAEKPGGSHRFPEYTIGLLKESLLNNLKELKKLSKTKVAEKRFEKFLKIGKYK